MSDTKNSEMHKIARKFALLADGVYGLDYAYKETDNSVSLLFFAGGYVEFTNDKILALIDGDRPFAWEIYPTEMDFNQSLVRICDFVKI